MTVLTPLLSVDGHGKHLVHAPDVTAAQKARVAALCRTQEDGEWLMDVLGLGEESDP